MDLHITTQEITRAIWSTEYSECPSATNNMEIPQSPQYMCLLLLGSSSFSDFFLVKGLKFLNDFLVILFSTLETSITPCCQEDNRVQKILNDLSTDRTKVEFSGSAATHRTNLGVIIHYNLYAAAAQMADRCPMLAVSPSELHLFLPKIPTAEMKERNNKVEKLQNEAIKMSNRVTKHWRKDKIIPNEKVNAKMTVSNIIKGKYKPVFNSACTCEGKIWNRQGSKRKSRVPLHGATEKEVKNEGISSTLSLYTTSTRSIFC